MRMIRITTFAALIIFTLTLHAQNTTKPFYFPNKTGDMWEYIYFEAFTPYVDTVQNFNIFDSTDSQGNIHLTQYGRTINPTQYPYHLLDTARYFIDSSYCVFGPNFYDYQNWLVYKLNANKGDQWVVHIYQDSINIYGYEIARVKDIWEGDLFGKKTTFMFMHYYLSGDTTDTTGLDRYWDEIADGFGLVSRASAEYTGEIHLIGAVINDTLYGDTTVVTIRDRQAILPLSIKLYQNYPNPFNPSTTISFEISGLSNISLIIYDVLGNEILKLIDNREFIAGEHKVIWNGLTKENKKAASGIYFYRLITENQVLSRSMILLK